MIKKEKGREREMLTHKTDGEKIDKKMKWLEFFDGLSQVV
jgi:hypothetical protein